MGSLNDKQVIIVPLMILANIVPVAFPLFAYPLGVPGEIALFFIFLPILLFVNYRLTKGVLSLIILSVCLIASAVFSSILNTYLYYTRISDDPWTPIVGEIMMYTEAVLAFIPCVISIIIKAVLKSSKS